MAMEPLSAEKWSLCLDSEGRVLDQYNVRKIVFHKGICEDIRNEVWPFLLGYYPFNSTSEERKRIDEEKRKKYESLLESWSKSSLEEFDKNFEEDAKIIEKDSRRTDRTSDFFSDENIHNVFVLERVLKTFALLRPDIGYVQGMSDIMALPLMVLNNEHQAFWCFDFIMKTTGRVFADLTLSEPLENLAKLCKHVDKPLFGRLNQIYEGEQWLFAYRLVLLNFKRELSVDGCSRLWECYWSCHATQHFALLFITSLLLHFRDTLFTYTDFEQLMEFSQCLKGKIPVNEVLTQAIDLLDRLKSDELCPCDIKFLVSKQVSAPPPLVGFVRTRQRVTSLYSKKFDVQRDQIWRALFGDTPMQSITSPFMLSPPVTTKSVRSSNWSTPHHNSNLSPPNPNSNWSPPTPDSNWSPPNPHSNWSPPYQGSYSHSATNGEKTSTATHSSPQESRAPPKAGFVPRDTNGFHLRDDIRRLRLSSTHSESSLNDNLPTETTTDYVILRSNRSAISSCTVLVDRNHMPVSNSKHENKGESENARESSNKQPLSYNQLCNNSCCPLSPHLCRCDPSCHGDSQFDSLRSEPELTCL